MTCCDPVLLRHNRPHIFCRQAFDLCWHVRTWYFTSASLLASEHPVRASTTTGTKYVFSILIYIYYIYIHIILRSLKDQMNSNERSEKIQPTARRYVFGHFTWICLRSLEKNIFPKRPFRRARNKKSQEKQNQVYQRHDQLIPSDLLPRSCLAAGQSCGLATKETSLGWRGCESFPICLRLDTGKLRFSKVKPWFSSFSFSWRFFLWLIYRNEQESPNFTFSTWSNLLLLWSQVSKFDHMLMLNYALSGERIQGAGFKTLNNFEVESCCCQHFHHSNPYAGPSCLCHGLQQNIWEHNIAQPNKTHVQMHPYTTTIIF